MDKIYWEVSQKSPQNMTWIFVKNVFEGWFWFWGIVGLTAIIWTLKNIGNFKAISCWYNEYFSLFLITETSFCDKLSIYFVQRARYSSEVNFVWSVQLTHLYRSKSQFDFGEEKNWICQKFRRRRDEPPLWSLFRNFWKKFFEFFFNL